MCLISCFLHYLFESTEGHHLVNYGGGQNKVKRLIVQLELHEPTSCAQRKALWESCMFEFELPQDIQNCITAIEKHLWEELDN